MIKKKLRDYNSLFWKRVYKPIEPFTSSLGKKIKLVRVLMLLATISWLGSLSQGLKATAYERAAWWPWSSQSHAKMAVAWLEAGNEQASLKELALAKKLLIIKTKKTIDILNKSELKIAEPKKVRKEIKDWEKILTEQADYRDVLLRLAVLNWRLNRDERAKNYWQRAKYLDPTNKDVIEIKELLGIDN